MQKITTPAKYDVLIIGAGVVGSAIARELSKFNLRIGVLEKNIDVGLECSSRNSGVIHSGIHYKPGTLRARVDVEGNSLMAHLCDELKVKYKYCGKLTVAQKKHEIPELQELYDQGCKNGVKNLKIINLAEMQKIQPGIQGTAALHSPTTGIVNPYALTIALAENAQANGANILLDHNVCGIKHDKNGFKVKCTNDTELSSKLLVNSAGLFSDKICRMLDIEEYKIYPCRGEYYVLDKRLEGSLKTLIYPVPGHDASGLGIHLTNTVDGNILIGPSNEYVNKCNNYDTTEKIMEQLRKEGRELLPGLSMADFIRSFSGLRPKQTPPEKGGFKDFVIEKRQDVPGFINLVGIESPGLTSAPAIAHMVRDFVAEDLHLERKNEFNGTRPDFSSHFNELSIDKKIALVAENPDYGEIVCRCEHITKKEVLDAIRNPLGARSIVSLKYRARIMMGRCQGGFCLPRLTHILETEYGKDVSNYIYNGLEGYLFTGRVRDTINN